MQNGENPFIDFLENTLGWRDHLASRLTDALEAAQRTHGVDTKAAFRELRTLGDDEFAALMADLNDDDRADGAVMADHLGPFDGNADLGSGTTGGGDEARTDGGNLSGGETQ